MNENQTFYIRLEDQPNPVPIDTHINPERTAPLLIPRTTVGHLISAFFPNIPPNERGKYTLYQPDGTTLLDPGDALPQQNTSRTPFIIKSGLIESSANSSSSSISCKSHSISGPCSTGRHVDRNKNMQKAFRRLVSRRDGKCVATGVTSNLKAAHIVPLEHSELIQRAQLFSPENGILLRSDLEDDYDRHMWIFDRNGVIMVLYQNWPHITTITRVIFGSDRPPSGEMINLHNDLALAKANHHCPNCWKYVGETNINEHQLGSCENINL